ncbi:resolvase [Arthrobacter glacialis]|uniref:Resolvase n=1 Tax=Arthrobacter glacialis TaxID=1664 RepID=A0A2S3ZWD6_ARTGL|nr:resolvase [Arthrobacter glacialis]
MARFRGSHLPERGREGTGNNRTFDRPGPREALAACRVNNPSFCETQDAHLVSVHRAGTHPTGELAELFAVSRSTVYRTIKRAGDAE